MAGAFSADTYRFLFLRKQLHARESAEEAAVAGGMCDTVDSFCRLEKASNLLTTFVDFDEWQGCYCVTLGCNSKFVAFPKACRVHQREILPDAKTLVQECALSSEG